MVVFSIILGLLILFILWNTTLVFYKDKNTTPLVSNEEKVFSPRCKSIVYNSDNDKAVFLIHGFPTTPQMYEYATQRLRDEGYAVYSPLIPTFGADYNEFSKTNFSQWFNFIDNYYQNICKKHSTVDILGVSMGGAMTLKLAEKYEDTPLKPNKIVVIAAPVVYNSIKDGVMTSFATYLGRTISLFTPYLNPSIVDGNPNGEDGNEDWRGYGGTFIKQGLSLVHNLKDIRKNLYKITTPLYSLHDEGDTTVPFKNQEIILREIGSVKRVIRSEKMENTSHSRHSLLMYHSVQKEYMDDIIKFLGEENE